MEHESGIYGILNTINGKIYIGQAFDVEARVNTHFSDLHRGAHYNKHLQSSYAKHGEEAFMWLRIAECTVDMLDAKEFEYIDNWHTTDPELGYNKREGGHRGIMTEEARAKMSVAKQGKKLTLSASHRAALERAHRGKLVSEETRQKLSAANKGKIRTEETLAKLRAAVRTDEQKERIRQARLGTKASEATKKKMSESRQGHAVSEETRRKIKEAQLGVPKPANVDKLRDTLSKKSVEWKEARAEALRLTLAAKTPEQREATRIRRREAQLAYRAKIKEALRGYN